MPNSSFDLSVHVYAAAVILHIPLWTTHLASSPQCSSIFPWMCACLIYVSLAYLSPCPAPFPFPRLLLWLFRALVAIVGVFRPHDPRLFSILPSIHLRSLRVLIQQME